MNPTAKVSVVVNSLIMGADNLVIVTAVTSTVVAVAVAISIAFRFIIKVNFFINVAV